MNAIDIIQTEHRRLAAVLNCLSNVLADVQKQRLPPDFELFETVVQYVETFLYQFHHPKEDEYLFRLLRQYRPDVGPVLDELEGEHRDGVELVARLRSTLAAYKQQGAAGLPAFLATVEEYNRFEWRHMATEERDVLPLARKALPAKEQAALDAVFSAHEDPLFGDKPAKEFENLYRTILNRTPAPHGLGPRVSG